MIRHKTRIPAERRRRRAVSLLAILSLLVGAFMPLAHASAGTSTAGTLLSAICSPDGIRYVEIDLGREAPETPRLPELGTLEHCPGCLVGDGAALVPVATSVPAASGADPILPARAGPTAIGQAVAGFRARAPPPTG